MEQFSGPCLSRKMLSLFGSLSLLLVLAGSCSRGLFPRVLGYFWPCCSSSLENLSGGEDAFLQTHPSCAGLCRGPGPPPGCIPHPHTLPGLSVLEGASPLKDAQPRWAASHTHPQDWGSCCTHLAPPAPAQPPPVPQSRGLFISSAFSAALSGQLVQILGLSPLHEWKSV